MPVPARIPCNRCTAASDKGLRQGQAARLHLPIGGNQVRDKRPEVIAAMVAAELLVHFMGTDVENPMHRLCTCP